MSGPLGDAPPTIATAPDDRAAAPAEPAGDRRPSLGTWIPGVGCFVYVLAVAADRVLFETDGVAHTRRHADLDHPAARVLMATVAVACLIHLLDGLRRCTAVGGAARWAGHLEAFLCGALGVPLAVAVLWPWLDGMWP